MVYRSFKDVSYRSKKFKESGRPTLPIICVDAKFPDEDLSGIQRLRLHLALSLEEEARPAAQTPNLRDYASIIDKYLGPNIQPNISNKGSPFVENFGSARWREIETVAKLLRQLLNLTTNEILPKLEITKRDLNSLTKTSKTNEMFTLIERYFAKWNRKVKLELLKPDQPKPTFETGVHKMETIFYDGKKFFVKETTIEAQHYLARKGKERTFRDMTKNLKDSTWHLCDLHTHLLGMGDTKFWCDEVAFNSLLLPPTREEYLELQLKYLPLIWNEESFWTPGEVRILFKKLLQYDKDQTENFRAQCDERAIQEFQDRVRTPN
jgi:hypothetical protein